MPRHTAGPATAGLLPQDSLNRTASDKQETTAFIVFNVLIAANVASHLLICTFT